MPPHETEVKSWWSMDEFLHPQPESKLKPFGNLGLATGRARLKSEAYRNTVIGVWDQDDRLECIFINGERFNPA